MRDHFEVRIKEGQSNSLTCPNLDCDVIALPDEVIDFELTPSLSTFQGEIFGIAGVVREVRVFHFGDHFERNV